MSKYNALTPRERLMIVEGKVKEIEEVLEAHTINSVYGAVGIVVDTNGARRLLDEIDEVLKES